MEQQGESSDRPPTDESSAVTATGGIVVYCLDSMTLENEQLAADLKIIEDAIYSHVIDCRMSVRHVLNVLESETAAKKVVNEAPLGSLLHKNYRAVQEFKDALFRWTKEQEIFNQDSVRKAFDVLTKRWEENHRMIESTLKE